MDSKQPVNFYFGGLGESGLITGSASNPGDKTSTAYIILQNDRLHQKVKELETEMNELNAKVQELEDDNESFESKRTSLMGLVKNEGEFNRLSRDLVEIYDNSIGTIPKLKGEFEWNIKFFGTSFMVLEICLILYKFYNYDFFSIFEMLVLNGIIIYVMMKNYKLYCNIIKINDIKYRSDVKKIRDEMKRAMKGNDYLGELIDRL